VLNASSVSADVTLGGTTAGTTNTVTAAPQGVAFVYSPLGNSCSASLSTRSCTASGTGPTTPAFCTLTGLGSPALYRVTATGGCSGTLRTPAQNSFVITCPQGGDQHCRAAFEAQLTPCIDLSSLLVQYAVSDGHCSAVRVILNVANGALPPVSKTSDWLAPAGVLPSLGLDSLVRFPVAGPFTAGTPVAITVEGEGRVDAGGCNPGYLQSWGGTMTIGFSP
jgi:hypothetical protein